ncbi:MAG TPA: tRNA pseudouridine(55) synthase TruB [Candidatus Sumerlaeota bacterium]|nr:tRNA pseudouridine(55) synthase TruB [Candidatus Sumerlaeota bacterium]
MEGVLLVNKPKGPTSHDVVARLRRLAHTRQVGHCGTLDPMAQGLLVCCLGRATRIVPWLTGLSKEYTGEMVLGAWSRTYDAEGAILPGPPPENELDGWAPEAESAALSPDDPALWDGCLQRCAEIEMDRIRETFRKQTGALEQTAPPYSAVKVAGRKLYEYAREGEPIPRKVRSVWVERFDVVRYLPPKVTFLARVGSGTYIRSLAHEAGRLLGTGAFLSSLVRTRVGAFHVDDAVDLDLFEGDPDSMEEALLSVGEALTHLPKLVLSAQAERRLRNGGAFRLEDVMECETVLPVGKPVLALASSGEALAVCRSEIEEGPYRPLRVLADAL